MSSQVERPPAAVADVTPPPDLADGEVRSLSRRRAVTIAVWGVLGLCVLVVTAQIATFDLRERPLLGDEGSHVLQSISIAYQGNLSYDIYDLDRFAAMEWPGAFRPNGIFYQRYSHGWAFAKPYGWSATAAPFVRLFGPVPGLAIANAALFLVIVAAAFAIGRRAGRFGAAFAVTSVLASVTWMYGFSAHSELFLAALLSLTALSLVEYASTDRTAWLVAACALSGFAVAEKPTFAFALAPVVLLLAWRRGYRKVVLAGLVTTAAFLVAIIPYLFYSDYDTWNPYAGERYYRADGVLPFAPEAGPLTEYRPMTHRGENFSPSVIIDKALHDPGRGAESFAYEFVGRYTGLLAFLPLSLVAMVVALRDWKRANRWPAVAVVGGLLLYMALYALVFPNNYFGGEQSLGNRYFVQVAPLAIAGLALVRPIPRATLVAWLGGTALAVGFLWPHLLSPTDAYPRLDRTSALQDLLPEEQGIMGIRLFRCGIPAVMWGPFEPYDERVARIAAEKECLAEIPPR